MLLRPHYRGGNSDHTAGSLRRHLRKVEIKASAVIRTLTVTFITARHGDCESTRADVTASEIFEAQNNLCM